MNSLRVAYKIFLLGVLAVILFEFILMITIGNADLSVRNKSSHWALILIIIFVILIEIRVRIKGGSSLDNLLKMHILFAVGLLATLAMLNFWFNGYNHAQHNWLAYLSFVLFLGTTGTGVPMILERF